MANQNFENNLQSVYQIPFDVIELPSKGILYPNKIDRVKVEYLVGNDENILTSINLINNGQVFDVLLQRKVKDLPFRTDELLIGDRNAILIWLRATAYGAKYPVKVTDPNTGEELDGEMDLTKLKPKYLEFQPDENGLFTFTLPVSGKVVKFKLLTVRDERELLQTSELKIKKGGSVSTLLTDRLTRIIKSIDGNTDGIHIMNEVGVMLAGDSLALRKFYEKVEPGYESKIDIETPSGGVVNSFFRIGPDFFYPDLRIS
jgi:hypothetical protein